MNENIYTNFVFYASWRELLNGFSEEIAKEILWNIMTYGTEGEIVSNDNMIQSILKGAIIPNINASQNRYNKSVENGSKGGRPRKNINMELAYSMHQDGATYKDIAEVFGVSTNTIQNRFKEYKNQKTNNNLDIDNDNDKDIDIDKENEPLQLNFPKDNVFKVDKYEAEEQFKRFKNSLGF